MNSTEKMETLIRRLNEASEAYYGGKEEIMPNYEWDALFDELTALEEETGIILPDSPTQNVSDSSDDNIKGTKEIHEFPALSLAKTKKVEDVNKWADGRDVWVSWKLDGCTIVLSYDHGSLTKIVTRGDGHIGTNITHLADAISGIPQVIAYPGHLVVRGECLISYPNFDAFVKESGEDYANPRNLAAGSLTLDDVEEAKKRGLEFVAFTLVSIEGTDLIANGKRYDMNLWGDRMDYLKQLDFNPVKHLLAHPNGNPNINEQIDRFTKEVELGLCEYPVDGLVVCYEDWKYSQTGSVTGHHSTRGGYAFKWQDESVDTELVDIEWSCATNVITPVAIFKPVQLEGTTVQRASLCNISECERLGIGAGSVVSVIKANKIIPKVIKATAGALVIPDKCPVCGGATKIKMADSGTKVLVCTNDDCIAKNKSKLVRFVSKHAMDIDGLSEATIDMLISKGWIKVPSDIYALNSYKSSWYNLEGFGIKSVDKLLDAIEASKNTTFEKFLYAHSIPNVGREQVKLLKNYLLTNGSKDTLIESLKTINDFTVIDGFGAVISESLLNWINNNLNDTASDVNKLLSIVIITDDVITSAAPVTNNNSLNGLTFVITGDVHHYKNRDELKTYIESCGGKCAGSVSKKTSYLINNDVTSTSGKNQKAQELGIPIISEDDFIAKFA